MIFKGVRICLIQYNQQQITDLTTHKQIRFIKKVKRFFEFKSIAPSHGPNKSCMHLYFMLIFVCIRLFKYKQTVESRSLMLGVDVLKAMYQRIYLSAIKVSCIVLRGYIQTEMIRLLCQSVIIYFMQYLIG